MISYFGTIATNIEISAEESNALLPAAAIVISSSVSREEPNIASELVEKAVRILITDTMPAQDILDTWGAATLVPIVIVLKDNASGQAEETATSSGLPVIAAFFDRRLVSLIRALEAAEALFMRTRAMTPAIHVNQISPRRSARVMVVGAGIVGLMTAFTLASRGFAVEIIERTGDPRLNMPWTHYGCTHGGANARMFSLTECDNYHERTPAPPATLHEHFSRPTGEMGWQIGVPDSYSASDREWVAECRRVPLWLADRYNEDIFELNHESYRLWQDFIERQPDLFAGVTFNDRLLRICRTKEYHEKQLARQKAVGCFIDELDGEDLIAVYPALAAGCANGEIHAGIEVSGFTLDIHRFCSNLIDRLEVEGVRFSWNQPIDEVVSRHGIVEALRSGESLLTADHYVLSVGSYGGRLLDETKSRNKVHGVLGAWITLSNRSPKLQRSLKIAREGHIAGSGNIILAKDAAGRDTLIFGSGFGYVGEDPRNVCASQLERLFASMESYIEAIFPEAYAEAIDTGELRGSRKHCIRPWTSSSLGVFEILPALTGSMIITSGHNTGGFSQSTAIAEATVRALEGKSHPMHAVYHPSRFESFWQISNT